MESVEFGGLAHLHLRRGCYREPLALRGAKDGQTCGVTACGVLLPQRRQNCDVRVHGGYCCLIRAGSWFYACIGGPFLVEPPSYPPLAPLCRTKNILNPRPVFSVQPQHHTTQPCPSLSNKAQPKPPSFPLPNQTQPKPPPSKLKKKHSPRPAPDI